MAIHIIKKKFSVEFYPMLILCVVLSVLITIKPILGTIFVVGVLFLYFYQKKQKITILWIGLIISMFLGSYLGIPGYESIFLFRGLLILQIIVSISYPTSLFKKKLMENKTIYLLLFCWIVGSLITIFWSKSRIEGFRYIYYAFESSCLIFLPSYYIKNKKELLGSLNVVTLIYAFSIIIGLIEVLFGWHLPQSGSLVYENRTSKFQPTGFIFNTNDYAMYLSIFLPLVFYQLYTLIGTKIAKVIAVCIWLVSTYLVIVTYSRLGIISIGLVSIIIFFVYFRLSIIPFLFLSFSYFLLNTFYSNALFVKISTIIMSSFSDKGASTDDRMDLYTIIWGIIKKSKLLGIGAGGVPIEIAIVRSGYETNGETFFSGHNFFLELLGEVGIFSLFLFCFFILLLYKAVKFYFVTKKNTLLAYIPIVVILIFLLSSVALSTIIEHRYLWFALGLALSVITMDKIVVKEE